MWTALGVVVGLTATAAVLVPLFRHWRPSRTWLTMLVVALVDVAAILAIVTR